VTPQTLAELTAAATVADGPGFTPAVNPKLGGVDPLGLRQINFDLMDRVLPGLNNVARHIRPFVVVTWAWRRAAQLAHSLETAAVQSDLLQDFVDRIEVLYALSLFLKDRNADLPGRQFLQDFSSQREYHFGGENWEKRRRTRSNSTGLSSALNYGPGLKSLGWLAPHREFAGIMMPRPEVVPALDALESRMTAILGHEAFNTLGDVTVSRLDVEGWGDAWALTEPTEAERKVMAEALFGTRASAERQLAGELLTASVKFVGSTDTMDIRRAMTGPPSGFTPEGRLCKTRDAWRLVQVRQLFRLSMEGLLFWIIRRLDERPNSTAALVRVFLERIPVEGKVTVEQWLQDLAATTMGPIELIEATEGALRDSAETDLPRILVAGLAFCLTSTDDAESATERDDRLPLRRARREARSLGASTLEDFLRHVFESWVLAQHTYWSVGRGLADARARGRTLLRLRVILDEGGWTLAPGVSPGGPPAPARDRLETAISLATECGLLDPLG
jgi:hypothetical protein